MMNILWKELEYHLEIKNRSLLEDLCPPAQNKDIEKLERFLQFNLPKQFKESLMYHNGQYGNESGFIYSQRLLPVQEIITEYQIWKELLDGGEFDDFIPKSDIEIKNVWWNKCWIPITTDDFGNNICIDLSPTPLGKVGQIIQVWHDQSKRNLLFSNFNELLEYLIKNI